MNQLDKRAAESKTKSPRTFPLIVQFIGVVIIAEFLLFLAWILFFKMDSSPDYWTRFTYLFNSLQAVAFAVVGALFGTQVQKIGTEIEKQRADKAEQVVQPSKELAMLVKDSSPDLTSVFANSELKGMMPTMQNNHARMQELATQILTS